MKKSRAFRTLLSLCVGMALTALFVACGDGLRNGDLVFVCADTAGMDAAISEATSEDNIVNYSHVGIVECTKDSGAFVIDATPKYGVSRHSLWEFRAENGELHYYRVKGYRNGNEWVGNAKRYIGHPYDFYFRPDNGQFYCSELVEKCCVASDGTPIFEVQPMNFRSSDGTIPDYWVNLFDSLGVEVPQGVPGTNPNDLVKSGRVERLDYSYNGRERWN